MTKRLLILLSFYVVACASPQKSFENKNYDKAYKQSLKALEKGKSVNQNQRILEASLSQILKVERNRANALSDSKQAEDWIAAMDIQEQLLDKISESRPYLGNRNEVIYDSLTVQNRQLRERLHLEFKGRGQQKLDKALTTGKKFYAQEAHRDFKQAKIYRIADPELDSLIEEAYKNSVVNYYVETDPGFNISYNWEIDRQFEDLEREKGTYYRIFYEKTADDIDCALRIYFDRLDFDERQDSETMDFEKEVIDSYETVTDTSGNTTEEPVYITVEGEVEKITRQKIATWSVHVNVNATTINCELGSRDFEESFISEIIEVKWRGDERAIPEKWKDYDSEDFMKEDDMGEELLEIIYDRILDYYF